MHLFVKLCLTLHDMKSSSIGLLSSGIVLGALLTWLVLDEQRRRQKRKSNDELSNCPHESQHRRDRLPSMIILVRHGESEGNADHTLYRTKPDNLVLLTKRGVGEAQEAGKRIEEIFKKMDGKKSSKIRRVHLVVSPFERTLQTAAAMRPWFEHRIVRTDVQPRIREQEFGNIQGDDFQNFRKEQNKVGRFWYRFPTGESGADVYDRVKSWWYDSVLNVNERLGYERVDAMVVVTHGLTMRFVLMQLYGWSPTTFHSVWNADNCDVYVLKKDLSKPGMSPYVLDEESGNMPKSSIDLIVEFKSKPGMKHEFKLADYLKIPPPRTTQLELVKEKLAQQYGLDKQDITKVMFMPFIDGIITQGQSSSRRKIVVQERRSTFRQSRNGFNETSSRFPSFNFPEIKEMSLDI